MEASSAHSFDTLRFDIRSAWRGLSKTPGFTAVIVITLALGIGANTAIFSVVHGLLLEPLPYRDSDRLAFIWLEGRSSGFARLPLTGPELGSLRAHTRTFDDFAAIWSSGTLALAGEPQPEQLRFAYVTTNFFEVLGAAPALGRTFRPEDNAEGAEPTILLGWDIFERRYGGDPAIVGRLIDGYNQKARVIGVMPKGFRLLLPQDSGVPDRLQAWTPFWRGLEEGPPQNRFLRVIGRLRPDVPIADARREAGTAARSLPAVDGSPRSFSIVPLQADGVREVRRPLLALFGGVAVLLAIACVNVAGLLIARAAARSRETSLRLALGARRGRLVQQALTEGTLLALLGGVGGVLSGLVLRTVLVRIAPDTLSRIGDSDVDIAVLAFTFGVAVLWGLLFSLAPLVEVLRADPRRSLQPRWRSTRTPLRYPIRAMLVTVQVALSVVLLVGAGLLTRTFISVLRVDPGFQAERRLTFRLAIPPRDGGRDAFNLFAAEFEQRIAAIPGVRRVGAISHLPYDDLPNWALNVGTSLPLGTDVPAADSRAVSPALLDTLQARLIAGRLFTAADADIGNPVAIVDDRLARRLWPDRSAIGQRLLTTTPGLSAPIPGPTAAFTVVGVVSHLNLRGLVDDPNPQLFVPWRIAQRNPAAFVVHTSGRLETLAPAIQQALREMDSRVAIYDVRPLEDYVAGARATRRFTTLLAAAFALSALLLTGIGLYGVLAYAAAQRRQEISVRRALGAAARQLAGGIVREALRFAVAGCVIGLLLTRAVVRLLESQFYGVGGMDLTTYAMAIALVLAATLTACAIPAWRVLRISPMESLRAE